MSLFDAEDLRRAVTTLGNLGAVAMGGLVLTGVPLVFVYDHDATGWLSGLHALASALLIGSAVSLVACVAVARLRRVELWVGWLLAVSAFAVAAAGAATGQVVRWRELVPPGASGRGLVGPLGGDVDAVVVGSSELSRAGFLAWALVHVVVVSAAAAGVAIWFRRRHRDRTEDPAT